MSFMSLFDKLSVNKDGNATDDSKSNIDGDVWCMFCSDNVINKFAISLFLSVKKYLGSSFTREVCDAITLKFAPVGKNALFFQVQANVIDVALFGELSDRSNVSHWIKVHNCVACGFCK